MLTLVSSNAAPRPLAKMTVDQRRADITKSEQTVADLTKMMIDSYQAGNIEEAQRAFNLIKVMAEVAGAQSGAITAEERRAAFRVVE